MMTGTQGRGSSCLPYLGIPLHTHIVKMVRISKISLISNFRLCQMVPLREKSPLFIPSFFELTHIFGFGPIKNYLLFDKIVFVFSC